MMFYVGLHQPSDGRHFERACISINRLVGFRNRRKPVGARLIVDSGAFSELSLHGRYRHPPSTYAAQLHGLTGVAQIDAAVAQDYMCEPFILAKTGMTVADHQRLTIERYDALVAEGLPIPIMPVLQGYLPSEYQAHVAAYGDRLTLGMWVGVGSICKRNGDPAAVRRVLRAIHEVRPDLRLHGFGLKSTTLRCPDIVARLASADSMAWSYAARREGRGRNDWREAKRLQERIEEGGNEDAGHRRRP